MATFTKSLEQAISQAFKFATEKKHQYVTLEHLLLALTDETDARNVMKACNVDVDLLNENLEFYIDNELDNIVTSDSKLEPQPTASLQVSKTGTLSAHSPPLPGVTPATTCVPYAIIWRV